MLLDYPLYLTDFCLSKSTTLLQSHRIQPELGFPIIPYNVYMLGFSAIACIQVDLNPVLLSLIHGAQVIHSWFQISLSMARLHSRLWAAFHQQP